MEDLLWLLILVGVAAVGTVTGGIVYAGQIAGMW